MDELSLYILDIAMNSVRAGATEIFIEIVENSDRLVLTISDNGCGMTETQVKKLEDPFYTTRKTRKVGLGIPFLKMLAEMTGGDVTITSVPEDTAPEHGTTVKATFGKNHIDFIPLGNMAETVKTLIQGSPNINFTYLHRTDKGEVLLACDKLREILGEIPLNEPEILEWIGDNLRSQYADLHV